MSFHAHATGYTVIAEEKRGSWRKFVANQRRKIGYSIPLGAVSFKSPFSILNSILSHPTEVVIF